MGTELVLVKKKKKIVVSSGKVSHAKAPPPPPLLDPICSFVLFVFPPSLALFFLSLYPYASQK